MKTQMVFSTALGLAMLALIVTVVVRYIAGEQVQEISYKTFRDKLNGGEVRQVVISQDRIQVKLRPHPSASGGPMSDAARTSEGASQEMEKENQSMFQVAKLDDPQLISDLQAAGVDYSGRVESHFIRNILMTWGIPIGALFFLGIIFSLRRGTGVVLTLIFDKRMAMILAVEEMYMV